MYNGQKSVYAYDSHVQSTARGYFTFGFHWLHMHLHRQHTTQVSCVLPLLINELNPVLLRYDISSRSQRKHKTSVDI